MKRFSSSIVAVPIVQSDTTTYNPPLRALQIFAAGNVEVVTPQGQTILKAIPDAAAGGALPFLWEIPISKVMETNTTVADAGLLGYRE